MNRQQRRTFERKDQKAKTKIYTLTDSQLRDYARKAVEDAVKEKEEEMTANAVNQALILLLTLPLEVLMDHYWTKSYRKKIPEFSEYVLNYYERWQNGELDIEKLKEDLWEYGGIRLEEEK